jgi:Ulp1 family protease
MPCAGVCTRAACALQGHANVFQFHKLYIPIHFTGGDHWSLVVADTVKRRIFHLDSLMGHHPGGWVCDAINLYLEAEAKTCKAAWKGAYQCIRVETPQQRNCVDCGVYTLLFARAIMENEDVLSCPGACVPQCTPQCCAQ